jgi:hypothetical protein
VEENTVHGTVIHWVSVFEIRPLFIISALLSTVVKCHCHNLFLI